MPRSPDLLRPSACVLQPATPPPIGVLLKTKVKVQFDRTVTERSKPLFGRFYPVESVSFCRSFCPCNPLPTHRSAVGRGRSSLFTKFCSGTVKTWQSECFPVFKEPLITHRPGALADSRRFLRANQARKRTMPTARAPQEFSIALPFAMPGACGTHGRTVFEALTARLRSPRLA
jgi:hypothetical protein